VPSTEVTIYKNYALGGRTPDFEAYEPIILTSQSDIDELFGSINSLRYRQRLLPRQLDIIGYTYMIEWDEHAILIMGYKYFIYNSVECVVTYGDFEFLDHYDWIQAIEA